MSDNEGDYEASVIMVDPNDIDLGSDTDEDENKLIIDEDEHEPIIDEDENELIIDEDENELIVDYTGLDPMSLVSVSLEEDEIEGGQEEEEASNADHVVEKCNICNKKCRSRSGLTRHMMAIHPVGCPVMCEYCGHVLDDQDTYARHLSEWHHIQVYTLDILMSNTRKSISSCPCLRWITSRWPLPDPRPEATSGPC